MEIGISTDQIPYYTTGIMKVTVNPIGAAINQYLMKIALPLGGYFIIEYLVRNYSASNLLLGLLNIPMMAITAVLLFVIIRALRDKILDGHISGLYAWTFGVQLMFFAGLIEASFIYIYNEFLFPDNLLNVHNLMIEQYKEVLTSLQSLQSSGTSATLTNMMTDTIEIMEKTPVSSAIESAITMLSNNIFYGMIIMMFEAPIIRKK